MWLAPREWESDPTILNDSTEIAHVDNVVVVSMSLLLLRHEFSGELARGVQPKLSTFQQLGIDGANGGEGPRCLGIQQALCR